MPDTSSWSAQDWINAALAVTAILCSVSHRIETLARKALERRFNNGDH